jgi:carbon-monoxide dehydrogenase large subunit
MKGVGEAGLIGSPSAVVSAIEDALHPFGARITEMPVTPDLILRLVGGGSPERQPAGVAGA